MATCNLMSNDEYGLRDRCPRVWPIFPLMAIILLTTSIVNEWNGQGIQTIQMISMLAALPVLILWALLDIVIHIRLRKCLGECVEHGKGAELQVPGIIGLLNGNNITANNTSGGGHNEITLDNVDRANDSGSCKKVDNPASDTIENKTEAVRTTMIMNIATKASLACARIIIVCGGTRLAFAKEESARSFFSDQWNNDILSISTSRAKLQFALARIPDALAIVRRYGMPARIAADICARLGMRRGHDSLCRDISEAECSCTKRKTEAQRTF